VKLNLNWKEAFKKHKKIGFRNEVVASLVVCGPCDRNNSYATTTSKVFTVAAATVWTRSLIHFSAFVLMEPFLHTFTKSANSTFCFA